MGCKNSKPVLSNANLALETEVKPFLVEAPLPAPVDLVSPVTLVEDFLLQDEIIECLKKPAYIALNSEKTLTSTLKLLRKQEIAVDLKALQGEYAYCIMEHMLEEGQTEQYLLLKPMDWNSKEEKFESNHGFLKQSRKKLPHYQEDGSWNIIVGGEITFAEKITWNVKSHGFSKGEDQNGGYLPFDLRNENFRVNLDKLWMPGVYKGCKVSDEIESTHRLSMHSQRNKASQEPDQSSTMEVSSNALHQPSPILGLQNHAPKRYAFFHPPGCVSTSSQDPDASIFFRKN